MKGILTVILGLAIATPTYAGFLDGNELLKNCSAESRTSCLAYVEGVVDAIGGDKVCLPDQIKLGQLGDIVLKSLRNFPETRHESAAMLVEIALLKAFCK